LKGGDIETIITKHDVNILHHSNCKTNMIIKHILGKDIEKIYSSRTKFKLKDNDADKTSFFLINETDISLMDYMMGLFWPSSITCLKI
jgi:hypothetical protein